MNKRYFFITTYDNLSGSLIASILNTHTDIHCIASQNDALIADYLPTSSETIDEFIAKHSDDNHLFDGNAQQFSAHELQNKLLMERTTHPLRKINLVMSPLLRIHFLINSWWNQYKNTEEALQKIENRLIEMQSKGHALITQYRLDKILNHILASASRKKINLTSTNNKLFLIALARVVAQDYTDLQSSNRNVCLEKITENTDECIKLIQYLTCNNLKIEDEFVSRLNDHLQQAADFSHQLLKTEWQSWQNDLLNEYLHFDMKAIRYQHTHQSLADYYHAFYNLPSRINQAATQYSKLISIHLNSNRPAQLSIYFDNIEETTHDLSLVEVLVNCDDTDIAMQEMLKREMLNRPFTIKYITSKRPASFCDLWEPLNALIPLTDSNAYFLLNISDEMLFATPGWDSILKKYVGLFPDNIFRLRASRYQLRNYFDRWECSFSQDCIPITTKKWIDIGGNWNPCFGPDSFQQLISFYLAKEGQFSSTNYLRELPIIDIKFHGDIPSLGIDSTKAWKLNRDHINGMQICQSYTMQMEAKRRAMLLKANIIAAQHPIVNTQIIDDKKQKTIRLIDTNNQTILGKYRYRLNWFKITFTNQIRKLRFYAYFGGGKDYKKQTILSFAAYLKAKYTLFYKLYLLTSKEKS